MGFEGMSGKEIGELLIARAQAARKPRRASKKAAAASAAPRTARKDGPAVRKRQQAAKKTGDIPPADASVVQSQKVAGDAEAAHPLEEAGSSEA